MQTTPSRNGQQQRGQPGRPDVKAREKVGEERVLEILKDHREDITALFATDEKPTAMYVRACALAVSAYRKIQKDAEESAAAQNKPAPRINEEASVAACLWAMQRKLDPGTDVYLVPYGQKVTPILSPQGVIKLIMRSGYAKAVNARAVLDGEYFEYLLGSEQWVKHRKANKRPAAIKDDRGQVAENKAAWAALSYAYCVIDLKDGAQVIEVHDRADIEYYRSLSPTATSRYSGWAKFPAEFARKAVMKQAAKFVPQESEVSILLAAEDTERGIEIPDELMRAVGARFMKEILGDGEGASGGAGPKSDPAAAAPPKANGHGVEAGDPKRLYMPGKRGEAPLIADAEHDALSAAEKRGRENLDKGEWDKEDKVKYKEQNLRQLATIRAEMKHRALAYPDHPILGEGFPGPKKAVPGSPADVHRQDHDAAQGELSAEEEAALFAEDGSGEYAEQG